MLVKLDKLFKFLIILIFVIIINFSINIKAIAGEWDIESLYSTTHTANIKSKDSVLEIKWEASEAETWHGFMVAFSSPSPVTIDDFFDGDYDEISARTVGGLWKDSWTKSIELSSSGTDPYYFNISVVDTSGDPHPISGLGPFFIDTSPPGSPNVTAPETTSSTNIILTNLGATDAQQVCISNSGYGQACTWDDLEGTNRIWTVKEGDGVETTIYVQFRDDVWNIATASATTTFVAEIAYTATTSKQASIPTLNEWGIIIFMAILIMLSILFLKYSDTVFFM